MKRPATLREAHEVVRKAKAEQSAGSNKSHRWAPRGASVWCGEGKDLAVPGGHKVFTIIGTRFFATTVFVGEEITSFINCRWDYLEDMHDMWASRLEYERVPRNGHLVWQAKLV